jgi:hypothetical protein
MANISNARINSYNMLIDGVDVGIVKTGSKIDINQNTVSLNDVDQYFGTVAETQQGWSITASVTLYEVQYSTLMALISAGKVNNVVSGTSTAYDFDTVPVNLVSNSSEVIFRPTDSASGDFSNDVVFWKANVSVTLSLMGDRTKYQEIPVTITAYPDTSRARSGYPYSATYARIGSFAISATDPDYIGIIAGRTATAPYKHVPAVTLDSYGTLQLEAFGAWITNTTTTAALDDATDINTTDTAVVYDAKSAAVDFTGKYYTIGTEVFYCSADSGGTGATGTLTSQRAACFSTAAAHLDNAAITLLETPIIYRYTNVAEWASSSTADMTIGNSNTTGNKGKGTWVSSGSTNVTAASSDGTPTSKNCVVTTNA